MRDTLIEVLKEKFAVEITSTYSEFYVKLYDKIHEAAVLDLNIRDFKDIGFVEEIKNRHHNIPIVILSNYVDTRSAAAAVRYGAFDALSKPFHNEELINSVEKAIAESLYDKELLALYKEIKTQKEINDREKEEFLNELFEHHEQKEKLLQGLTNCLRYPLQKLDVD
jgi:DNA-binding NtrC family response regulator